MSYAPSYSNFFANNQSDKLPIAAPSRTNPLWNSYGTIGKVLGALLIFFGMVMIPLEISRIIQGSLNRATTGSYLLYPNYNIEANAASTQIKKFEPDVINNGEANLANRGIVPESATAATKTLSNFPIQDKYIWPWSHAALLFSLVTIAAGIVGVLSGFRRTYTSIYAFFIMSMMSTFLSTFLVAYFATHVYWQLNINTSKRKEFFFVYLDYALGCSMLAVSCTVCFLSIISTIYAAVSAGVGFGSKAKLLRVKDLANYSRYDGPPMLPGYY